ncbi:MAG: FlgD immunoglobulin-like domain containing protein, partial [bacterium]|nr:FlgD immunoglobulin-like domain containing protein [bacterium]
TISIEQKYDADVEDEFGNEVPSPHDDDVYLDYLTTDGGKTSDGDTGVPLTFEFLPSGKIFAQPVTFKVPLPEGISAERASKSRLYFWDVVEWVPAGGEVKEIDGRYWIYVELNHFSTYAVVLEETPAPSASGPLITGISLSSNPFTPNNDGLNDRVTIRFGLARASTVNITVYDTGGNVVRTLVEIKEYPAGWLSVQWDGTTRWEGRVTSGNYILEIDASSDDGEQRTETMLLGIVR